MSEKIKINTGENTDVKCEKCKIINFRPLNTKDRKDDEVWNSMEFMCKSDEEESDYESPGAVSEEAEKKIASLRVRLFGNRVKSIYNTKAA